METDKNEDDEKKKKKGKVFSFCVASVYVYDDVYIYIQKKPNFSSLSFSSKMWLHQGEWEDYDASREGETRDCCFQRDHHRCKWITLAAEMNENAELSLKKLAVLVFELL